MPASDDNRTDRELVTAANAGDQDAFGTLYRRYRDWAYSLAVRFGADRSAACDVLQEAFLYFFRKFPGFELRCQLKTFLYPTVKHIALTYRRKSSRTEPLPDNAAAVLAADRVRDESAERLALADLVQKLPDTQREVILLRYADGLDLAEIAQALEIPLGTVKSRLHNALARLRKIV